jgi:hypothetical protein
VLSDENDWFVREYELPATATLLDFHRLVCADLGFGEGTMASFHTADREWTPMVEYTLIDMGGGATMDSARIADVVRDVRQRLIYTFDLLDERALYMELTAIEEARADGNPRVVRSEGDAPSLNGAQGGSGSIFDEAMGDFGSFEGDEGYDDE